MPSRSAPLRSPLRVLKLSAIISSSLPSRLFPSSRNQEKDQFRYDVTNTTGRHTPRFGVNFVHEPVFSGTLASRAESLYMFANNPTSYLNSLNGVNPQIFANFTECNPATQPSGTCTGADGSTASFAPAADGAFAQNVQRLGVYAQDSWRIKPSLTLNYGLRYDTTFGLFLGSGRSQLQNPTFLTLKALDIPLVNGAPSDYRGAIAPRFGFAYAPHGSLNTVIRAGVGMYYNDLGQNGWASALQAVDQSPAPCNMIGDPGCVPGSMGDPADIQGSIIAPGYKTPYTLEWNAGIEHEFSGRWHIDIHYEHSTGDHQFRNYQYAAGYTICSPLLPGYSGNPANPCAGISAADQVIQQASVPNISIYRSDNRSNYNGVSFLLSHSAKWYEFTAHYTLSKATTWGAVLGELDDYVNLVSNPLNPFGPGDNGPSGEDVRSRFVLSGILHLPGKFELSTLTQLESARPFQLTTPVDVNGAGLITNDRAVVNGVQLPLDSLRGTPYMQVDLRVARPIQVSERFNIMPFIEFFNLLNRANAGANYVTNIPALTIPGTSYPLIPSNEYGNITSVCTNATARRPRRSPASISCASPRARSAISSAPAPPSAFPSPPSSASAFRSRLPAVSLAISPAYCPRLPLRCRGRGHFRCTTPASVPELALTTPSVRNTLPTETYPQLHPRAARRDEEAGMGKLNCIAKLNWGMKTCGVLLLWAAAAVALFAQITPVMSSAPTFISRYSFCSQANCTDGLNPNSLVQAADGNLYGTTERGNTAQCYSGCGTVFQITPNGELANTYTFCSEGYPSCPDGTQPAAGLIQSVDGDLYGATGGGGANDSGTVFRLATNEKLTTLFSFCGQKINNNCLDGAYPYAGLIRGIDGNFYGTTVEGGDDGDGTIFKTTPGGNFTTLHSFDGDELVEPMDSLTQGPDGSFYGTTRNGGGSARYCTDPGGCGIVFRITPSGAFTTLYHFCSQPGCADGDYTWAGLVLGADGNFYGATGAGGLNKSPCDSGCGTVFRITPGGDLTTIYSFCPQSTCSDGIFPIGSLIQGTDGNFYGTTYAGGNVGLCAQYVNPGCGTIFQITPHGSLTMLHAFDGTDGVGLFAGLVQDTNGIFYGTTEGGGANDAGTVFSLSVGLGPFVETNPVLAKWERASGFSAPISLVRRASSSTERRLPSA